jgi:Tfp pilus assembly protein PilF
VLQSFLAELEDSRGHDAEAMRIYRQILQRNPQHVLALNNLAFMLAVTQGDTAEALALVNAAIDQAGPVGPLLDTRAVIYLKASRTDLALKDLQQAVLLDSSWLSYFHLAQAHFQARDRFNARKFLAKATELGLKADALHRLELEAYRQLTRELDDS